MVRGDTQTKDAANSPEPQTSVVINELMFDPPSDQGYGEYVELYNKGDSPSVF